MSEPCDTKFGPCACGAWHNDSKAQIEALLEVADHLANPPYIVESAMPEDKKPDTPRTTGMLPELGMGYDHGQLHADKIYLSTAKQVAAQSGITAAFVAAEVHNNSAAIHTPGMKADHGKPQVVRGALRYFPEAVKAVAQLSQFGAEKYTWDGWRTVPDGEARYMEALMRHLLDEAKGPFDAEWQERGKVVLHATAVAWNALARLELMLERMPK